MRTSMLMSRLLSLALVPALLSGCAGGSPLPGKEPVDTLSSMYTTTPAQQVATCIAQVAGGSVRDDGTGYAVTSSSGTRYSVGLNNSGDVYPVQVLVRGTTVPASENEQVALCLRATGSAA